MLLGVSTEGVCDGDVVDVGLTECEALGSAGRLWLCDGEVLRLGVGEDGVGFTSSGLLGVGATVGGLGGADGFAETVGSGFGMTGVSSSGTTTSGFFSFSILFFDSALGAFLASTVSEVESIMASG
ncbi:hypothetical protein GCM10007173_19870 [Glutamicibacter ardleyensis]|uniref:Uncharacterized protein n=1 Tax=Glutamicibacter ardleyensis TaxID=225894 RepID=A0ABQ2DKI8_9MICC|nr:hypothetical protein GCM10007173_19870 [Glutamicibacter ardleyensis]